MFIQVSVDLVILMLVIWLLKILQAYDRLYLCFHARVGVSAEAEMHPAAVFARICQDFYSGCHAPWTTVDDSEEGFELS